MEIALSNNFNSLESIELTNINGGVNWDSVWNEIGILGAGAITIAGLPATLVGASAVAMALGLAATGAAGGYFIGSGLTN